MKTILNSVIRPNRPVRCRPVFASRKRVGVNVIRREAAILWSRSDTTPLRTLAVRFRHVSKDPKTSRKEIADMIGAEPMLRARLLRAANSAYFGFGQRIETVEIALLMLGTDQVEEIIGAMLSGTRRGS